MDRGLEISDVADQLHVTADTLVNWEQGHFEPQVTHGALILEFLGYCPFEEPETLAEELVLWRWSRGLSHRRAAAELGVNPSTWQSWEQGKKRASFSSLTKLRQHGVIRDG